MEAVHSDNSAGSVSWLLVGGALARIAGPFATLALLSNNPLTQPTLAPFALCAALTLLTLIAFVLLGIQR